MRRGVEVDWALFTPSSVEQGGIADFGKCAV